MSEGNFYYNLLNRTPNEKVFELFLSKMRPFLDESCMYEFNDNYFNFYDLRRSISFSINIEGNEIKLKRINKEKEEIINIRLRIIEKNDYILLNNKCLGKTSEKRDNFVQYFSYGIEMAKINQFVRLHNGEEMEMHKEKYIRRDMNIIKETEDINHKTKQIVIPMFDSKTNKDNFIHQRRKRY